MNQDNGNWHCMACGKDTGVPMTENLPEELSVIFAFDDGNRPFPVIVCEECNPKEE